MRPWVADYKGNQRRIHHVYPAPYYTKDALILGPSFSDRIARGVKKSSLSNSHELLKIAIENTQFFPILFLCSPSKVIQSDHAPTFIRSTNLQLATVPLPLQIISYNLA